MHGKQKTVYFVVGLAAGLVIACLGMSFPGGRGNGARVQLSFNESELYRVQRVVDGDTIVIEPGIYVRYAGINTPEVCKVTKVQRPFGPESSAANRKLVENRKVRLRFGERKLDRYGRLLACVEVRDPRNGRWIDVGEELARQGLARPLYMPDRHPNRERVSRAVEAARAAGLGIWGPKSSPAGAGQKSP